MSDLFLRITAFLTTIFTLLPSVFGFPSAYKEFEEAHKFDSTLGQIIVDDDMSVPRIFITQNNKSDYVIVTGENASPSEINAAEVLQDNLKKMSGITIPIVRDNSTAQEKEIIVGKTNRESENTYSINRKELGDEGLSFFVFEEKLIIAGGEKRGTLYGVYTFLEEVLGFRWFSKNLTVVPENKDISVRRSLNVKQVPCFEFRDLSWKASYDENYRVARKINTNFPLTLSEKNGGGQTGIGLGHSFDYLLPASEYFQSHPEYYALTENGIRETRQPCLSNPDVIKIITENTLALVRKNPNANFVSVSQNDNEDFCRCENCKAIDDAEGSHSGTLVRLLNAVADEVAKEFPNTYVQTLSYNHTRMAPKLTRLRDNIIIHLCSDETCFSHPIEEECLVDKYDVTFVEALDSWKEHTDNIYVYDYTTNFSHYSTPFPNFHVLQKNMQFFAENKISGVWEEGCPHMEYNGEFSHLKAYIISKLLWDPYTDVDKHMNEFMRAFYGKGYQEIRKYIDFSSDRARLNHIEMWASPTKIATFTSADLKKIDSWWDKAESLAENEFQLNNLEASKIQIRYYKNFAQKAEFSRFRNSAKTGEALYDDMMRFGIYRVGTAPNKLLKPKDEIDFTKPIREWRIDA